MNDNFSKTPEISYSEKELILLNEIEKIKATDNISFGGESILKIQTELESINGSTYTDKNPEQFGTLVPASRLIGRETDNLVNTSILNPNNVPIATAFQIEQRGATAGTQWLAIGFANGDTGFFALPDTLAIFNSTNHGETFNLYAMIAFSGNNKFTSDDMDMEIIENTAGEKYIHVVFGYITNGGYGQRLIGYTIIRTPTLGYAGSTLIFPGYNFTSQYFQARITSDNARYAAVPYITIVLSQDSIANNQSNILTKMCKVLSPYSLSPGVTYLPKSIYNSVPGSNGYAVMTDVANYHNSADSLFFVLSNYPGFEPYLYLYKAESNTVSYPVYSGMMSSNGENMEYARIASSGGTNQPQIMMSVSIDYQNSGDFDLWGIRTFDAVNWFALTIEYSAIIRSRYSDIIAKRNVNGSFNIAYKNLYYNMENVGYYSISNSQSKFIYNVNTNYANSYCSPKPAFRYFQNDSCQIIWSDFYRTYSTHGCEATYVFIKAAVEGYYNESTDEHSQYLAMYALLRDQTPPYNIIDTGIAYLDYQSLNNVFTFPDAPSGNFYLVLKHYNTIETWSSVPVSISNNPVSYDFTDLQSKAYGNNMMMKGSKWCIYSGDVTQDGFIDINDLQLVDNDVYNFITGYSYLTDLNGDFFVDIADYVITDNNALNFVSAVTP
ncbi:MAG TPA: hypothetical protein PK536_13610 [Ignavibacteria bacterium]|nr:hypothetical protein [Ignavibacteria bacterium]HRK00169.1 hypothetical protein [Ignavibacteria bacterium]